MPPRPSPPLDVLQRWMQAVIMHPGGAAAGIEGAAARRELDLTADELETVINRSESQTSLERLSVYANAYLARLLECLRFDYPMFARAVGAELFDAFAVDYLQRRPSRSYTLNRLGAAFPEHLAATRPSDGSQGSEDSGWSRLLVELARFERALGEVFDGPGCEGGPAGDFSQLAQLPLQTFAQGRLILPPCVRLLACEFPVNEYWEALRTSESGRPPLPPRRRPTWIALTRVDYIVRRCELSEPEFRVLTALQNGATMEDALALLVDPDGVLPDEVPGHVHGWFAAWRRAGLIHAFAPSEAAQEGGAGNASAVTTGVD